MSDESTPPPVMTRDVFDQGMARAMEDVPVPAGLIARLQAGISSRPMPSAGDASHHTGKTRLLRRFLLGGCAAVAMFAAWSWFAPNGAVVTEADVRRLAGLNTSLLTPAASETRCALPIGWQSVRGLELAARLVVASDDSLTVPMLPLSYQADRRSPRVTGLLLPLRESSWAAPLATGPFSAADVQYTTTGTWAVWREGTTVFVLILHGDAPAMERLQWAAAKHPSLT